MVAGESHRFDRLAQIGFDAQQVIACRGDPKATLERNVIEPPVTAPCAHALLNVFLLFKVNLPSSRSACVRKTLAPEGKGFALRGLQDRDTQIVEPHCGERSEKILIWAEGAAFFFEI